MTTQPVTSSGGSQYKSKAKEMKSDDFIKMMIVQLQNQDPYKPASNQELMGQMSQISQLQSSTMLQDTLKDLGAQNQIGAAGNLLGRLVEGLDENNEKVKGVVASVRVESGKVFLELENGHRLPLGNVTTVAPASAGATTSTKAAA